MPSSPKALLGAQICAMAGTEDRNSSETNSLRNTENLPGQASVTSTINVTESPRMMPVDQDPVLLRRLLGARDRMDERVVRGEFLLDVKPRPLTDRRSGRGVALACWLLASGWLLPAYAGHEILIVFDEDNDLPGLAAINHGLREALLDPSGEDLVFYNESLQFSQFRDASYEPVMQRYLAEKYGDKRLDLIVAVMEPSLDFLLRHRETLFGGVPIVFCGADAADLEGKVLPPGVTGVMMKRNFGTTLEIALALQPGMRHVFVVGGTSRFDQRIQAIARRDLAPYERRASIEWLTTLPMGQLLDRVADLPPRSIILYLTLFTDGEGKGFVTHDALRHVTSRANAPVYVSVDQYIGTGAVGGSVYSVESLGARAGAIGTRLLAGTALSAIPPVSLSAYVPMFDWRQLKRWRIDVNRLPAGTVLLFRTPTVWESHGGYIAVGVSVLLLQTAMVIGLLFSRAARRRAELARGESETRRRLAEGDLLRQRDELAHAQRVATLGELAASFAHEIKQPLTAMVANAQAVGAMLSPQRVSAEVSETLQDLAADAIRAADTIERIQAMFRKQPAVRSSLELNALIDDVLRLLASDIRHRQITVQFIRAPALSPVVADDIQLRQVILNILRNAEEAITSASGAGVREIRIETSQPHASQVEVTIRDSGVGVDETQLEQMFEHFVTSKPQGLGLGLAISRSIIESHGGRIWATRNDGTGITMHVKLPC